MALIKCSECGKDVSDKANFCPHCGNPDIKPQTKKTKGEQQKTTPQPVIQKPIQQQTTQTQQSSQSNTSSNGVVTVIVRVIISVVVLIALFFIVIYRNMSHPFHCYTKKDNVYYSYDIDLKNSKECNLKFEKQNLYRDETIEKVKSKTCKWSMSDIRYKDIYINVEYYDDKGEEIIRCEKNDNNKLECDVPLSKEYAKLELSKG